MSPTVFREAGFRFEEKGTDLFYLRFRRIVGQDHL